MAFATRRGAQLLLVFLQESKRHPGCGRDVTGQRQASAGARPEQQPDCSTQRHVARTAQPLRTVRLHSHTSNIRLPALYSRLCWFCCRFTIVSCRLQTLAEQPHRVSRQQHVSAVTRTRDASPEQEQHRDAQHAGLRHTHQPQTPVSTVLALLPSAHSQLALRHALRPQ